MKLHSILWKSQKREIAKIVLLHGLGGTGALWRPISASLEEYFSLLALDQRGHGRSQSVPLNEAFGPLDYGRDVVETLEALEFSPCWAVGHSLGVRTACAAAHLKPALFEGLVLIDLGLAGPAGGGLNQNLASFLAKLPKSFPSRDAARAFINQNSPDPAIGQYVMAVSKVGASGEVTFPFDHSALLKTLQDARSSDLRPWIQEFGERELPVLLLRGTRSKAWSHEEYQEEKKRFSDYPSIRFVEVEGAGHGLPFERREEFVRLFREFVGSNCG